MKTENLAAKKRKGSSPERWGRLNRPEGGGVAKKKKKTHSETSQKKNRQCLKTGKNKVNKDRKEA